MTRRPPQRRERRLSRLPAACVAGLLMAAAGGAAAHPLDPLGAAEIEAAVAVLRAAGHADDATRFSLITLDEPDKAATLRWRTGQPRTRRALVVARRDKTVYEAVVDLALRRVERWIAVPDVQSAVVPDEWQEAQRLTKSDPAWQAAMRRRGYAAFDQLFCAPLSAGNSGDPAEDGRRLVRVACFDSAGTGNLWARPIEGLLAVVDLDQGRVLRLIDSGPVAVSRDAGDFGARRYPSRPTANRAPAGGRGFAIDGYRVRWRQWSFRYRMDPRAGLVLALVRHADAGRRRLVLYRGSVAELFVPYMDPDPAWAFRTWLDVGEHGFGTLASPLVSGVDCPAGAAMLDAVLADAHGRPRPARSVACLFERRTGAPLWRHAESANRTYAGRAAGELVLRTIPSVGNYDYVIDWVLAESGVIRIDVGATGIVAVKGVSTGKVGEAPAAGDTAYGALVAPNLVAVNHDHFLSFRLDFDIDGAANTLVRRRLEVAPPENASAGRSVWSVAEEPVTAEGPLAEGGAHGAAATWRIVNPNLENRLGRPPGYALRGGHSATSLLQAADLAQRRAGFSAAPLWVTAYDPRELYAAGMYPNQSAGGDGLPAFVARQRPVENADIVLWYTMGFHHLPRPEDWPIMNTIWHSVSLVPDGFFAGNPGIGPPGGDPGGAD